MPTAKGTTSGPNTGLAIFSPSTADSTEMAGVTTPSPYSRAEPASTMRVSALGRANGTGGSLPRINPSKARVPPSPSWSARRMKPVYLMHTIRITDHRMSDRIPITAIGSCAKAGLSLKHCCTA